VNTPRRLVVEGGSGSSGLYAYRSEDGTFAVSVLVYPKAWPADPFLDAKQVYRSEQQGREVFTLLLQEGRSLNFSVSLSSEPAIDVMISELRGRRSEWRKSRKASSSSTNVGDTVLDEEDSDQDWAFSSGTSLPVECALTFTLVNERSAPSSGRQMPSPEGAAKALTAALRDLAWLCLRAGALRSAATDGGGEETAGQLLDAARAADEIDPLALLAELDFVHEMHRLQHRIRKGYVPEEDRLAAIRGRITDRGVLEYEMTGIPLLECRFDEFVEATPLFRVLVTALDVVSAGGLRSSLGVETDGLFGSMSEVHPTTMREQLRSIPSLPLPVARATADRLRLTRLQQEWQRPLDLAKRILRAESVETGYATQEGSMTVWTVDTAKVWEKVLERAFQAAGVTVSTQQGMNPPWQGLGAERRPDLTVTHEDKTYLLDAKYKLGTPGSSTADQYQMFAYSLISKVPPDAVALVYPSVGEDAVRAYGMPRSRQTTNLPIDPTASFVNPSLHLLTAPFPRPETVRNEMSWTTYLALVGEGLVEVLTR
jgi:hypothetical protein